MPNDCRVRVEYALRDQITDQCGLIGISRGQADNLCVRWVGIESFRSLKWIVDNAHSVEFLGNLAYDSANVHLRETASWLQTKTEQSSHFAQLMALL